ncbi:MAG: peptidylprolyl isomerase [Acidobacteriota bacterium]|nr:MAG: peptidylprolyl isomerase [Acidobacteriota bacterium]
MSKSLERTRLVAAVTVVALLVVVGLVVWSVMQERANAARTESEILKEIDRNELAEVLKSEATADISSIRELNESPERRKEFLKGLEEHLALAAQARREGYADVEDFRINLEYKTDILLADLYQAKLSEGKDRLYVVPPTEMEKVWKDPANEARYKRVMDALLRIRKRAADAKEEKVPVTAPKGETLRKSRDNFARTTFLSSLARKDKEFMSQPAIPLRIKILEAGLLANDYLIANYPSLLATDAEVAKYLADHPEYDPKRKYETARTVLAKVKAGESFEELAKKYSEDGRSSHRGGLYEDVGIGALWPEFEERVKTMKPGEIADELIETELGWHILKFEGSGSDPKTGRYVFSVRHIVLQRKFEEPGKKLPGIPRPFMTPVEIAKQEVERQKREAFIARVKQASPVSLPEDFKVELEKPRKSDVPAPEKAKAR